MDERLDLEIRDRRLFTLVVHGAQGEQLGDGVASAGRSPAHAYCPAVSEGMGSVTAPVVLGRFQIPGEYELRQAESVCGSLQFFRRDLWDIPELGDREVIEALSARRQGDVREI